MIVVKWIISFLQSLNSNQRPGEIAGAAAFAFMLALMPSSNLLWMALFTLTFFLKINNAFMVVLLALFKIVAPLFDPLLHQVGYAVLTIPNLKGFYASLYNTPLMPFTKFNNTIVLGGFITGIVLWIPMFVLFLWLVGIYRSKAAEKIRNSKFVQFFMRVPVISGIVNVLTKAAGVAGKAR
jgi:uncharacterized protein (TIGR03546 family)